MKIQSMTSEEIRAVASAKFAERMGKLTKRVRDYVLSVPGRFRNRLAAAYSGEDGITNAVRMKCFECCGFEEVETRVPGCTSVLCPLYAYRQKRDVTQED